MAPPSVESTQSDCLTRSTRNKRNSGSEMPLKSEPHKKSRGATSLNGRPDIRIYTRQWMQESQKKGTSSTISTGHEVEDIGINVDLQKDNQRQEYLSFAKDNNFLKCSFLSMEDKLLEDVSIRSMLQHFENLARAILISYEKERQTIIRKTSESTAELAQLRYYNTAIALEVANLRSEKAELARRDLQVTRQLEEVRRESEKGYRTTIIAILVMGKALMLREKANHDAIADEQIDKLKIEKADLLREKAEIQAMNTLEIEKLRSNLAEAGKELAHLRAENSDFLKIREEREATIPEMDKLHIHLADAKLKLQQLLSEKAELMKEQSRKDELITLELEHLRSEKVALLNEKDSSERKARMEIENWRVLTETIESKLQEALSAKEDLLKQKDEVDTRAKVGIEMLQAEMTTLLREKDESIAKASLSHRVEMKNIVSRFEAANVKLKKAQAENSALRRERTNYLRTGVDLEQLRAEKAAADAEVTRGRSEILELTGLLVKIRAEKAKREAEALAALHKLSRELGESRAREAAALEKVSTIKSSSDMHIAFLSNWGLKFPNSS